MPTERELAEDAQWKLIQKNTFTRWANEHLKLVNKVRESILKLFFFSELLTLAV